MPKAKFDLAVATIKRGVPRFSDAEIILRLTRLVASLGVGHTHVLLPSGSDPYAFHMYPIRIRWFSDGLAVVSAARADCAVGGHLTRIGA